MSTPVTLYTAPRSLDPQWLRAGDQVAIAAEDPAGTGGPVWHTVIARLTTTESAVVAIHLDGGDVITRISGVDVLSVRIPAHVSGWTGAVTTAAEYVQPGWLVAFGDLPTGVRAGASADGGWYPVADTRGWVSDCTAPVPTTVNCAVLGFTGHAAEALAVLAVENHGIDIDASEPGTTWLHLHAGDPVTVRIPCELAEALTEVTP